MTAKPFGFTGCKVPEIGQGTWNIEGSREQERRAIEALQLGIDLGLTHIDTAEMYGSGRAEELVGEALEGRRDEVFLVSKVLPSNASYRGTIEACERSLKRLRTDRLDLYLLHWPGRHPIGETMRALEDLAEAGKIRFLGVSNFDVEELQEAERALKRRRIASNQVLYHLGDRGIERRLLPYCRKQEIAVVGYSPFYQGRFPKPGSRGARVLEEVAVGCGRTPRQVILRFLSRDPAVFVIPKASRPEHVRDNAGGAGWELTASQVSALEDAFPAPSRDTPLGML